MSSGRPAGRALETWGVGLASLLFFNEPDKRCFDDKCSSESRWHIVVASECPSLPYLEIHSFFSKHTSPASCYWLTPTDIVQEDEQRERGEKREENYQIKSINFSGCWCCGWAQLLNEFKGIRSRECHICVSKRHAGRQAHDRYIYLENGPKLTSSSSMYNYWHTGHNNEDSRGEPDWTGQWVDQFLAKC